MDDYTPVWLPHPLRDCSHRPNRAKSLRLRATKYFGLPLDSAPRSRFNTRSDFFGPIQPKAQVAQSVEQGTENPRVGSSILSLGTNLIKKKPVPEVRNSNRH